MRVAEIYKSVQGEGFFTGTDSVFVRASGCNLRCRYCDTPYASWQPEGDDLAVQEIRDQVLRFRCRHAVLTGGEPMLFAELIPLCAALRAADMHVTVETAGTLYLPVECDLMSLSPKLSNSTPSTDAGPRWRVRHERTRIATEVLRRLVTEYSYQIKFVVETVEDCVEAANFVDDFPEIDRDRVMLMPQATDVAALRRIAHWLEPYCRQHGLRFCPRKQLEWYGLKRGT
jgi:7-carboxy-7-deazaguanine synthase